MEGKQVIARKQLVIESGTQESGVLKLEDLQNHSFESLNSLECIIETPTTIGSGEDIEIRIAVDDALSEYRSYGSGFSKVILGSSQSDMHQEVYPIAFRALKLKAATSVAADRVFHLTLREPSE